MRPRCGPAATLLAIAALAMLGGCTTLGGHVKGSFACQAPQGICAPSSTIDDRALAMIAGDAVGGDASPAAPLVSRPVRPRSVRTGAVARPLASALDAQRTGEKVLRVVLQPYVDDYGRLHEASVVRTVVRGEWQAAAAVPPAARAVDPALAGASLAEAIERADPPAGVVMADPDMPSAAAVAAARAKLDPAGSIKADVARRLAARTPATERVTPAPPGTRFERTGTSKSVVPSGATANAPVATRAMPPAPQVSAYARPASSPAALAGPAVPAPGASPKLNATAAARVSGDPRAAAAAAAAQAGVRRDPAPPTGPPSRPVVHATSFPGADPKDD